MQSTSKPGRWGQILFSLLLLLAILATGAAAAITFRALEDQHLSMPYEIEPSASLHR